MRASAGRAPSRRPASPPARPFVRFLGGALLRKTFCLFDSSFSLFVALKTGLAAVPHSGGSWNSRERRLPRSAQPLLRTRQPVRPPRLPYPPPAFVRRRKPTETSLMHPFQWCNGCFCGLGLVSTNKSCSMPPISFQDLPLNIYMVIFGTGIFVFMLSLIFCCYFISKLRNQAQSERYGYKEVVLKGDAKKLQLYGQTCAVCLEDFKGKDELGVLPCQHAFHRKCLVKWLEVRCVCPMCNKPIAGPTEATQSIGILLDELV
ncbi:RING finger protein 122 [Castor canadensis]|uniref:RING finger protein 122 n=1 Tax=Castor canadensis TaxID=51338 RepID=UPI003D16B090